MNPCVSTEYWITQKRHFPGVNLFNVFHYVWYEKAILIWNNLCQNTKSAVFILDVKRVTVRLLVSVAIEF